MANVGGAGGEGSTPYYGKQKNSLVSTSRKVRPYSTCYNAAITGAQTISSHLPQPPACDIRVYHAVSFWLGWSRHFVKNSPRGARCETVGPSGSLLALSLSLTGSRRPKVRLALVSLASLVG